MLLSTDEVLAKLPSVLVRRLGAQGNISNLRRVTGGATKGTWFLDWNVESSQQRLVLQLTSASQGDQDIGTSRLLGEQDAMLMKAAFASGVPVPEVLAVFDEGDAIGSGHLTRFVAGETLAPKILREAVYESARKSLAAQCGEAIGRIQAITPDSVRFLPLMDAQQQWQHYRQQVDYYQVSIPALEWGLKWLEHHLPLQPTTPVVVHGDFRLGNLIVNEQGLACVIDWELAVLGDPMQDLAWLCLKTWRFSGAKPVAGVGELGDLYAAYEKASGQPVNLKSLQFWEVFGHVKWAVMCLSMGLGKPGEAATSAVSLEHCVIGRRLEEPLWDLFECVAKGNLK